MYKQQGWPQAWEYCQAKPIQTLGRASQGVNWSWSQCIKSHHAQTSSGKELPSHFWTRNIVRSILPGLKRKITGLRGPKSSFQIKVHFYTLFFLLLTSFIEMLNSFSSRTWHLPTLPKLPKAGSMTMVLLCLIGQQTRLTWIPLRLYGVLSRRRWETQDPTMQMTQRPLSKQPGLHYTWAVPQTDHLHPTPHWCSKSCKRRPNQVSSE